MSKARWWRNYWRNSSVTVREYFPRAKLFAFVRLSLWSKLKQSFMPTLKSLGRAFASPSQAFLLISLLSLSLAEPIAVRAAPVAACTEEDLRIALSEGGTVTFLCSGTITVTNTIVISTNVVLDGTGTTPSISGGNAVRIFSVNRCFSFTVKNLTLNGGADTG